MIVVFIFTVISCLLIFVSILTLLFFNESVGCIFLTLSLLLTYLVKKSKKDLKGSHG
jgi:hypothetical protein